MGQSRPSRSALKSAFVRCWSNSDHSAIAFVCPLSATSSQCARYRAVIGVFDGTGKKKPRQSGVQLISE
jgi:hypothetical protein